MDKSLTLLATILLTLAQSIEITVQQIGTKSYAECKATCDDIATGLATSEQILDYLAANGGPLGGDVWTPISEDVNGWVQIGGGLAGHPYAILHSAWGVNPTWGTESTAQPFKKTFYCIVATCNDIWNNAVNANALVGTSNTYELVIDDVTQTGRCIFTVINDNGEVFVGTMFEYFSRSDAALTRCGWNDDGTCSGFTADNLDGIESSTIPQWYRWSALSIKNVRNDLNTPYLFVTCNSITDLDGDHLLMPFAGDLVNRPDNIGGECFPVDSWQISGNLCENTIGAFWMNDAHGFHIDSTLQARCENEVGFNPTCGYVYPGKIYTVPSEDDFGFYLSVNTNHECSAAADSTTSYFMGEIVQSPIGIGCASSKTEIEVISDAIYACPGTITSGGTYGTDAQALCNTGYEVCEGAEAAEERGLTQAICTDPNIFTDPNQFFGTKETSAGGWNCYHNIGKPNPVTKYEDIWGCANENAVVGTVISGSGWPCGPFTQAIGNDNLGDWVLLSDAECGMDSSQQEGLCYTLTDAASGGVLCCKDIFCAGEPDSFNWNTLTDAAENKPIISHTIGSATNTLTLDIRVELEYEGYASADYESGYGVTYVLDFEDFDAYKDNIFEPGTCQNRVASDFDNGGTQRPFDEWWQYSSEPALNGHIGDRDYMAYPPGGDYWTVSMKDGDECSTVVYEASFTWNELVACSNTAGGTSYVTTTDGPTDITLEGVFYVNVVSPYSKDSDVDGYYRVYQLLSQPFTISISKSVYVLGSAGVNILTMSVIAVYKENANDFRLVVLTESQKYLQLLPADPIGGDYLFEADETVNVVGVITQGKFTWPTESDSGCLNNKQFICSQLWEIQANNLDCKIEAIDFSGKYTLAFDTACRTTVDGSGYETYCAGDGGANIGWLAEHSDIEDGVRLSTHLTWKDGICDPTIMNVQFDADMKFYTSAQYKDINDVVDGDGTPDGEGEYLFPKGTEIYVEIDTDFAGGEAANIFDTQLTNVWICTFEPTTVPGPINAATGVGGCMDTQRDGGCSGADCEVDNGDNEYFYHIYQGTADPIPISLQGFNEITTGGADILRFYFTIPNRIARDKLYVHAQVEVTLITGQRRRLIIHGDNTGKTGNQMDHFIKETGLTDNNNNNRPVYEPDNNPQPINNYPQQPNTNPNAFVINLSSPWIIGIGGMLSVVLICNIVFMCYMNCNKQQRARVSFDRRRRNGYSSVKNIDSDVNDSEVNAINVVSDQSD